jgi:DNA-binding NtrC family response regulator
VQLEREKMENYKVLVIEDNDTSRERLAKAIRKEGYEVLAAEHGEAGLELFKKELPEIIITDLKMPGIDGLEVMHTVRRLSKGVQVILITAYGETDTAISALREGALDYLKKPLDLDQLTTALGRAREKVIEHKKSLPFPTVLLAEDEAPTRDRIARVLEKEGWKVFTAADGEEAIKVFERKKIDIVLLDIKMPKKDGLQALHEMRGIRDDFEAIVLTGYGDQTSAIRALRDGAINFLKKPIDLEELVLGVEKGLEKLHTERSLKYRNRELELANQIIGRITAERKIVIDINSHAPKEVKDFALQLLDIMPLGIAVIDKEMTILYINPYLLRAFPCQPEKLDEAFIKRLDRIGIKNLSYKSLLSNIDRLMDAPAGKIETISTGKYSFIILVPVETSYKEKMGNALFITMGGQT